jgi:hypothetical protein
VSIASFARTANSVPAGISEPVVAVCTVGEAGVVGLSWVVLVISLVVQAVVNANKKIAPCQIRFIVSSFRFCVG